MRPKPPPGFEDVETLVVKPDHGTSAPSVGFVIRVTSGPDQGKTTTVDASQPAPVLVGQSASCGLVLGDRMVSRRHLSFEHVGTELRVTDLGSTNGTRVEGVRVADAFVRGGERVELGATSLLVERVSLVMPPTQSLAKQFGKLLGASPEMRRLYPLLERLAASDVPVVIEGETGTGKEVLAESLHEQGPRSGGPFAVFDCTAIAPSLLESALFGHERGAFTGASELRRGIFEEAHGGTLFIDEIGDLDIALQARLLRALERSEVRRMGGSKWIRVSVRVIAATRRNLDLEVQEGRFRDDLFFRLAVARVELPPLRKRHGDIELLARTFWGQLAASQGPIPGDFLAKLVAYSWPGNVRELHKAVARRVALGEIGDGMGTGSTVGLPRPLPGAATTAATSSDPVDEVIGMNLPFVMARDRVTAEFERRYVEALLERHGGNVAQAAAASGIALRYFQLIRARARRREGA